MSHKKFWPDRFSRFDVYWIQTNKQTDRQAKFIYRFSSNNSKFNSNNLKFNSNNSKFNSNNPNFNSNNSKFNLNNFSCSFHLACLL